MSRRSFELEIFRFRPDLDEEPGWDVYTAECDENATLLDALRYVQDEIDPGLSIRWSCRAGQCGACGMSVNDAPVLACRTRLGDLHAPLRVAPLANFPVIRDLVVEIEGFASSLHQIRPWSGGAHATARSAGLASDAAMECVECGLCRSACAAIWRSESFVGPAALARAWTLTRRGDDEESAERRRVLAAEHGVWGCDEGGECDAVCPYGISSADAAAGLKLDLLLHAVPLPRAQEVIVEPASYATRTSASRAPRLDLGSQWRRMLPLGGLLLALGAGVVLRTWRALSEGPGEWSALLEARLDPASVVAHAALLALSLIGVCNVVRHAGRLRRSGRARRGDSAVRAVHTAAPHGGSARASEPISTSAQRRWLVALEPLAWAAATIGGWIAVLSVPALLVVAAFALPLGWLGTPASTHGWLRACLVGSGGLEAGLVLGHVLVFWHAGHQWRYFALDVAGRVKRLGATAAALGYGAAVLAGVWAARVVWTG